MNHYGPLSVLVVDDDKNICRTLSLSLKDSGCRVTEASSVPEALRKILETPFDLVLSDFRMEGKSGLDLVKEARKHDPELILVIMTAFASIENAVSVVREGAFDYLPKPFTAAQLAHVLEKVRLVVSLRAENRELKRSKSRRDYFSGMTSPASRRLEEIIRKVSPTDSTILLVGESGTGKSELAKLIHEWSPRSRRRFVTVECTALSDQLLEAELFGYVKGAFTGASEDHKGKLEVAEGGTVFLDEIGELSLSGQTKLLRFLQERVLEKVGGTEEIAVDTRVIAATNKDLEQAVAEKRFREDLYYRLNILECVIVPLRHRKEDLPLLIKRLLTEISPQSAQAGLPSSIEEILLAYSWPGNVRELRNTLERIVMLSQGRAIEVADLPDAVIRNKQGKKEAESAIFSLEEMECKHIREALEREKNLEKVAEALGITTVTLWRKRKIYGLD